DRDDASGPYAAAAADAVQPVVAHHGVDERHGREVGADARAAAPAIPARAVVLDQAPLEHQGATAAGIDAPTRTRAAVLAADHVGRRVVGDNAVDKRQVPAGDVERPAVATLEALHRAHRVAR